MATAPNPDNTQGTVSDDMLSNLDLFRRVDRISRLRAYRALLPGWQPPGDIWEEDLADKPTSEIGTL